MSALLTATAAAAALGGTAASLPAEPPPGPAAKSEGASAPPSEAAIERQSTVKTSQEKRDRWNRPGSPQRFALEIKLGPYLPDVDLRYDGPGFGPYATLFGETNGQGEAVDDPKPAVMPIIGFEWQFAYFGGPLGLGTQVGFFRDKAKALLSSPREDENVRSEADDVTFGVVPLSLLIVYRFELLADRFKVPLVPYAKAGAGYGVWWTKNGNGDVPTNRAGNKGVGGVWGWQLNAGGMLRLDFIERASAKRLDQTTGINHTYLFGEYQLNRLDNFGVGESISVGDSTWFAGLAIEF